MMNIYKYISDLNTATIVQYIPYTVLELWQLDLKVWGTETLPDAPSILGNLAG